MTASEPAFVAASPAPHTAWVPGSRARSLRPPGAPVEMRVRVHRPDLDRCRTQDTWPGPDEPELAVIQRPPWPSEITDLGCTCHGTAIFRHRLPSQWTTSPDVIDPAGSPTAQTLPRDTATMSLNWAFFRAGAETRDHRVQL